MEKYKIIFLFNSAPTQKKHPSGCSPSTFKSIDSIHMSSTISRVLSLSDHLSGPAVANRLKRPTRKHGGPPYCFLFGLASDGVYICPPCYQRGGELLPRHSNLTTGKAVAVYFCCTSLGVASTGRYPASCPVKPGLSSPFPFRLNGRGHLCCS